MSNQKERYSRKINDKKPEIITSEKKQISKITKLIILGILFLFSVSCIIGVVLLLAKFLNK